MSNLIGQSLGRYHILEQLGEGGMATVYKAYDTRLETDVAVKVIRTDVLPQNAVERTLKRFEREAKSLARLTHPNIVKVMDYGEYDGAPYLVLVYLPGGTLKKHMGQPMPWQEAVRLLIPIANALEYAHEHKVVHRDVKPANILLTEKGQPMLTDFGIAKILEMEDGHTLTGTGMGIGTPEYMSPEQGMGREVDGRADIYSMGIILYELITGRKPYTADTPMAVVVKHLTDPLPRPRQFAPDLPEPVEKVLIKSLAKDLKDRYPDAGAFVTAMEALLMGASQSVRSTPAPRVNQPVEPDLETQDTYVQRETISTKSQTGTYTEAPRKTRTTQMMNPLERRQPKKIIWWPWAVGGIGLILAAITFNNPNLFAAHPTLAAPAATEAPAPTETTSDGSSMIGEDGMLLLFVPEGEFTMGSDTGESDEKPIHTVYLDAYWIDQTEVTNKQYAACEASGGCTPPSSNSSFTNTSYYGNAQFDDYPVIYVDWKQAKTYCEWAGRRLPSEAEWEKAARGESGNIYPWGNTFDGSKLNFCDANCSFDLADKSIDDGYAEVSPVGSYPAGVSQYGAYDMAGNLWEWVNDWYGETYYQSSPSSNPVGASSGEYRVLRGGSWYLLDNYTRSASRNWNDPSFTEIGIGFRCSRSQ